MYLKHVVGGKINKSLSSNIEYVNYPFCELTTATGSGYWACRIYLPKSDEQKTGYPAFSGAGTMDTYFIASMLPDDKENSLTKAVVQLSGASYFSICASATITAIVTLLF